MPYRDDHPDNWRGPQGRSERDEDRWGGRGGRQDERRSFGEEGRFNSDQARYRGADDHNYAGRGGQGGRGGPQGYRGFEGGYGGQEYGLGGGDRRYGNQSNYGGGGDMSGRSHPRDSREFQGAPYGDQSLPHGSGVEEFGAPHDYAYHPDQHDLDPDYVTWRDQQMRNHDREYQGWRAEQHRKYDDDYRRFRGERRNHFHQTFEEWRQQQQAAGKQGSEFAKPAPELQQITDGESPSPIRKAGDGDKKD